MENNNVYSPLNILLADDDKDDCLFFQDALEDLVISTTFAAVHDGEQLIRYLTEGRKKLPTVIFLDLNMPRKTGFACLEEIKSNESLRHIPVIIFSTSYDENIAGLLYKNGAHYYICKPPSFSHLKKVIGNALTLISKAKITQPPREEFLISDVSTLVP